MLVHPLGELRRAHQAGLHRDVGEVRGGDDLLVAVYRRRETAEHGDDLDHDRRPPSLRWALALPTVCLIGALSCCSLIGSAGGKMLSYIARASRIKRARSRSDFGENRTTSPICALRMVGCAAGHQVIHSGSAQGADRASALAASTCEAFTARRS
jgi:hypothetical protein